MSTYSVHKYPKSSLHEFYQVFLGSPRFVVEAVGQGGSEPRFRCKLTCPAVNTPHASFEETVFVAEARAKKAAEHAASEKALEFIRSKGLLPMGQELPPPPPLTPTALTATQDEIMQLKHRVFVVGAQLEAQQAIARGTFLPESSMTEEELAAAKEFDVDVDALSEQEVRSLLKKALEENKRLRAKLAMGEELKRVAVEVLQSGSVAPAQRPPAPQASTSSG